MDFQGKDIMIGRINAAVTGECPTEITTCLRKALCDCISDEDIRLPQVVYEPIAGHYARRQLHHDQNVGYSVIAMTWGPGQGTPIHDHCGMWCVEGVWSGCIEVVQYHLQAQNGEHFKFEPAGSIMAGCGSAGSLIPPYEYHTICNAAQDSSAVSVHIYSGAMTSCNIFQEAEDGWYQRCSKQLSLD